MDAGEDDARSPDPGAARRQQRDELPPLAGDRGERGRRPSSVPATRSLQRLAADLRRLSAELVVESNRGRRGNATRVAALNLAYDQVLLACAEMLGISGPVEREHSTEDEELPGLPWSGTFGLDRPLPAAQRLTLEVDLARAGLVW